MKCLIMIAHGSKKEKSNNEFKELVHEIKKLKGEDYDEIIPSFLEFEEPSLENAFEELLSLGAEEIVIYPYFLNSGKHVTHDIPEIVALYEINYPHVSFIIKPHFGLSNQIAKIISNSL